MGTLTVALMYTRSTYQHHTSSDDDVLESIAMGTTAIQCITEPENSVEQNNMKTMVMIYGKWHFTQLLHQWS